MEKIALFWFRRDLRLDDNHGLYRALSSGQAVLPIFIFDPAILDKLDCSSDRRVSFIHSRLVLLQQELRSLGSSLLVRYGPPLQVIASLLEDFQVSALYCNEDYEPFARKRDDQVAGMLRARAVPFHAYKDHVIFAGGDVIKDDGTPYKVFTPYSRKWHACLGAQDLAAYDTQTHFGRFLKVVEPYPIPPLAQIGFQSDGQLATAVSLEALDIRDYHNRRDRPDWEDTTRLGVHLRFGTISIQRLVRWGGEHNHTWLNQLVWRDFFTQILHHYPRVETEPFRNKYSLISWRNDAAEFEAFCKGQTGYPIVDAGMRQLNATGYMHNRVRMIVASFMCKHLLIHWSWGERYFARHLLDFDLAANNGNWQWSAGTGCDAAPYFRIFNPWRQQEKFDPQQLYIRRWVEEYQTPDYVKPMVDHPMARLRALEAYKRGIGDFELQQGTVNPS